jgi:adenosylhomocysteine nucleosidase
MKNIVFLFALVCGLNVYATGKPVLVISGMTQEANIAAGKNVVTLLSGGSATALAASLAKLNPNNYSAVVSFGVAGGLNSMLQAGSVVTATMIVDAAGDQFPADPTLLKKIKTSLRRNRVGYRSGAMAGSNVELTDSASKVAFASKTGALTVDTESHVAAAWAQTNGLPFAALRTVSDPEGLTLPALVVDALNPDGSLNFDAIMKDFWKNPLQLGALIEVGFDAMDAFNVLRGCRTAVDLGSL